MKLTRRGKLVRAVGLMLLIIGLYQISTHLWWVDGGYCWGSLVECN